MEQAINLTLINTDFQQVSKKHMQAKEKIERKSGFKKKESYRKASESYSKPIFTHNSLPPTKRAKLDRKSYTTNLAHLKYTLLIF